VRGGGRGGRRIVIVVIVAVVVVVGVRVGVGVVVLVVGVRVGLGVAVFVLLLLTQPNVTSAFFVSPILRGVENGKLLVIMLDKGIIEYPDG